MATVTVTTLEGSIVEETHQRTPVSRNPTASVAHSSVTSRDISTPSLAASPLSSRPRKGASADDESRMPPTCSLATVLYFSVLCGVNLVIVIPTADDYSHRLGGDQLFGGLMIGAVPLLAMFGIGLNQFLLRRGLSLKTVLLLMSIGTVLGNVLYAVAGLTRSVWSLLAARCVIGLCNGFNLPSMYIGLTVGMRRRSEVTFYFSALNTLGYALGPALAAVLEVFVKSVHVNNLILDSDTAPGWFMAILYLLFMAQVLLVFEDLPAELTGSEPLGKNVATDERPPMIATCAAFLDLCISSAVLTTAEVYVVNVGQHYWGWSVFTSALFLAALMLCASISNLVVGRLTRRFMKSDRTGLLIGSILGCAACAPLFHFDLHAVSTQASLLSVGLVLVLSLVGLIRAFALAASSKLAPASLKSSMNSWAFVFMTLGRGAGAVIGSVLSPLSFAPVVLGMLVVTVLASIASHSCMKPSDKAS
mmetsp:Transcript_136396/g.436486  ORF Transcript_136396/g.436486 Transcript_136396/m.436486 type:complete len:476 (-) Transcript_136396:499-1926(-)